MKEDDLHEKTRENIIFSVYMYKCCKYDVALLPKNKDNLVSKKYN